MSARNILVMYKVLLSMAMGCSLLFAKAGYALDLVEVYQLAQTQDPSFEAARYTLEASRYKYPQARAMVLPTVNLTGNRSYQDGQASFAHAPFNQRKINSWGWNFQLTQPLLRVANWVGMAQAQAQFEQAQAQFEYAHSNLIVRVTQAYFDVLHSQDSTTVALTYFQAIEQQSLATKKRYEAGEVPVTEMYDAQARVEVAQSQWMSAKQEQINKEAELEQLIGTPFSGLRSPLARLASTPLNQVLPKLEPTHIDSWFDSAYEYSPLVRSQLAAVAIAEKEVQKNRAAHLPTLDFTASYSHNDSSGSLTLPADTSSRVKSAQLGVQLTIPLYAGGANNARVSEAVAYQHKARADLESARRQVRLSIRQAYNGVINGQAQIQALSAAMHFNQNTIEANQAAYRIGQRIQLDTLTAKQQLLATQRDWAKACYDTLLNGLRLKAAAGSLSIDDIAKINTVLSSTVVNSANPTQGIDGTFLLPLNAKP